jgi:aldehyde:ferredoxin oxidoreductase
MIDVSSTEGLLRLFEEVETLGLDAISSGVVLAWATEAQQKGLISDRETAGLELRWGDHDTYLKALRLIVDQPTDFYGALARGVDHASSIYGGADFALAFGGIEMAGYHTGPSAYAGYMTGARHSHLDGAGYSLDQKSHASGGRPTVDAVAQALLSEESWRQVLSSLVICYFGREIYTTETVLKTLKLVGYDLTPEDLLKLGREVLKAKYDFKIREGFDFRKLRLPKRVLETATPLGQISESFIFDTVQSFASKVRSLQF